MGKTPDGPITGNRGEWSEIYAFLRLLCDGELHGANADLSVNPAISLKVLKVARMIKGLEFGGAPSGDGTSVKVWYNGGVSLSKAVLERRTTQLLNAILHAPKRDGSFSHEETEAFLRSIGCVAIKAASTEKRDLDVTVQDDHTGGTPTYGFSIKSRLGAPSTLLNAADTTLFSYAVPGLSWADAERLNAIVGRNRYKERAAWLTEHGLRPKFVGMCNATFFRNLQMLDDALPEIMAALLLDSRMEGHTRLDEVCGALAAKNPRGYQDPSLYGVKVRRLLRAAALGMVPGTAWADHDDATGGYIIVKEGGELVAFFVYNRAKFDDYLFHATRFEMPSGDRYHPMRFYRAGGEVRFDLCLQIRFR